MTILREILARFTVDVDSKKLTDLEKKLKKAKKEVNSMGQQFAVGLGAAAYAVFEFTQAASHASEVMNVLDQVFDNNSDSVVDWSKTMGKALGRSQYALQDSVSKFGAFMDPIFKGTNQDIMGMSESLATLAVDLASFYDTSDEEAQMRLFSGLSGETEAVRRLGIDISDSSLKELHERTGGKGQYKSLSMAEKTQLRFMKIMEDSVNAQGDAIRTANGWANTLRRLQGKWLTFTVEVGKYYKKYLLPVLLELEGWIPTIEKLVLQSTLLSTTFEFMGLMAASLTIAFAALNMPLAALTAAAVGLFLVFEDLRAFQKGGRSVFGEFISAVTGATDPLKSWNRMIDNVMGALDMLGAGIWDWAVNLKRIATGEIFYKGFTTEAFDAAHYRATQGDRNEAGVQAGLEAQRNKAAAAGDTEAFEAAFSGNTRTGDELMADFNKRRLPMLQSGAVAGTLDDVASGLVDNQFLVKQAQQMDVFSPDALEAAKSLAGERASQVVNINIGELNASSEDDKKRFFDEQARQLNAILQENR